jgi:voltage-gated potassium channel
VKIVSSLNRGMAALSRTMKRRAFGYVVILTLIVTFGGAAGMYAFEDQVPSGLNTYGTAVWWTTMIMTTLGSEYWPKTPEGRILCIILSLYAFAVFGYITATIATFFVDRDAADKKAALAGSRQLDELKAEIQELKKMITDLSAKRNSVDS